MKDELGTFRFTYFADRYDETYAFYKIKLAFSLEHSWDINEDDKGVLFKIVKGRLKFCKCRKIL